MSTAKTNAQRQAEHKARRAAEGYKEVRGIVAHVDDHDAIRAAARKMAVKLEKARLKP